MISRQIGVVGVTVGVVGVVGCPPPAPDTYAGRLRCLQLLQLSAGLGDSGFPGGVSCSNYNKVRACQDFASSGGAPDVRSAKPSASWFRTAPIVKVEKRFFEPPTRAAVAARRCGESARECLELAEKLRTAHSSGEESDASGYETDTTFTIEDAVDDVDDDDDEATNGDESMAAFSSAKTIYEYADVVRVVAASPSPPLVEREDPTEVDWEAALPTRWPADLGDLYADNPAGARTWSEVEAAMHRLAIYHTVRDVSRILYAIARRASARMRTRTQRTPLAVVRRRCRCLLLLQTKLGECPSAQIVPGEYTAPLLRDLGLNRARPTRSPLGSDHPPLLRDHRVASGKRPPRSPLGSDHPPLLRDQNQ